MSSENYINHIALVLDASTSMRSRGNDRNLVKVADAQIAHLAQRSKDLDQETRVSVYTFADTVKCVIFDKDVLRLPSIASLYYANGRTALIDATLKSQDDLAQTAQMYGDHSFLTFVLTDGGENQSRNRPDTLLSRLTRMPDNWTVAVLVPDVTGVHYAKGSGFPAGNIAQWDPSAEGGVDEAMETIRRATDTFMTGRASGIRGSRAIFSGGADKVNASTVKSSLKPLDPYAFDFITVHADSPIREFVESRGMVYNIGSGYYQLTKSEKVQSTKQIAIREIKTGKVYTGRHARDLLGLPDTEVRVRPDFNPEYQVFVQSTSVNRKLIRGTDLLLMKSPAFA